ncbi:MAG: hypothetical protein M1812_006395 [Candelaria pacifica]|nr:MAG: hypothetical protein M1812_006395 [Candelaria pacifica]
MAPPGGNPKKMWKLSFTAIFGFPLPGQIEYMVINSVQSLIATSDIIRDAFLNVGISGRRMAADLNFSNRELVQQLEGFYWGLSRGFEELLHVPFADLQQNMRDIPDVSERLRRARDAAINDMNLLATIASGGISRAPRIDEHRGNMHAGVMGDYVDGGASHTRDAYNRYRSGRPNHHGHGDHRGEPPMLRQHRRGERGMDDTYGEASGSSGHRALEDVLGEPTSSSQYQRPERRRDPNRHEATEARHGRMQEHPAMMADPADARRRGHGRGDRDRINRQEGLALDDDEAIRRRTGKHRADRVEQGDSAITRGDRGDHAHHGAADRRHRR